MDNKNKEKNKEDIKEFKSISDENSDEEKIEICFICHKKFDINKDDESYYRHGKYPMCAYCAEFYGFYR